MSKKGTAKTVPTSAETAGSVRQRHNRASRSSKPAQNALAGPAATATALEEEDADERKTPHIPGSVVRKLVIFSLLLLIAPILVYFTSLKYVFVGSTAASAITAVVAANMVLVAWVYTAWSEDEEGI
ncbi:hypothetical protein LPJ59_001229 [Coemansia sp. RSA 2399]|nr:hypothetical protein LPJ59_001229 [Coemansia sp. RSA 2399]KAJ1906591.1 hypothetical protein LPJ81_001270 [Coemansia sp. IMI 209127]